MPPKDTKREIKSRVIKFRAWDKNAKRFLSQKEMTEIGGFYYSYGVDPDPEEFDLMQFTGLLDKHGKEIYEGDIILQDQEVIWKNDGWGILNGKYNLSEYRFRDDFEVIGNAYETPELLAPIN